MVEQHTPEQLTLEEKAAVVVGAGFWTTAANERTDLRSVIVTDGPHGIRKQATGGDHLGLGQSVPATCFPPAAGIASSWNVKLMERVGVALGEEARAQDVAVLLGPGVNIKRSPLCGRNFEYFSEDPLLSGELGAAWVRGIQSQGVGASLKHFAANNQETNRMTVSAEVDERTLREIYFPAFERIVTREQPWTVMCSYNRVNGVYASENHWLLTDVLRTEWGFEGLVVSDWGAVDDRVAALSAGLDLEMPGPQEQSSSAIVAAVRSGALTEALLDASVARIRRLADRAAAEPTAKFSVGKHHTLAREAATESMVLLRNEGDLLPLDTAQAIGVIGEFARSPRFQGAGSSQVNPTRTDSALDAISAIAPAEFAPGYSFDSRVEAAPLIAEAVAVAKRSNVVLLFVGLPAGDESEGYDRAHLQLPPAHTQLIAAVAAANPRTVVILTNGGVVSLEPWHDSVPAILEAWLLGQAGGSALADVLFGRVSPSGRLAESIPVRLQDNPSFLNFPGDGDVVRYGEGIFVGYRYYETVELPVRYPFGHGLGYTTFSYADLEVARDGSTAAVTVTNTGDRVGSEVVQLYVSAPVGPFAVPRRELRAFDKVRLEPGETARVAFDLERRAYSHFDVTAGAWTVSGGEYVVAIGRSASDMVLTATVRLAGPKPGPLTMDSPVSDFLRHPVTGPILARAAAAQGEEGGTNVLDMVGSMPMRRLLRFPGVGGSIGQIRSLMRLANVPVVRSVAGWFGRRRS
ncbi:MAG: glycoside hydrolase family 3 C-terminal domain-containing protein [Rhodoglobus sp.]